MVSRIIQFSRQKSQLSTALLCDHEVHAHHFLCIVKATNDSAIKKKIAHTKVKKTCCEIISFISAVIPERYTERFTGSIFLSE